jgi:hypothetical protein
MTTHTTIDTTTTGTTGRRRIRDRPTLIGQHIRVTTTTANTATHTAGSASAAVRTATGGHGAARTVSR